MESNRADVTKFRTGRADFRAVMMLEPEERVREFVREAGKGHGADDIATLVWMAEADGDYSRIERECISALAKTEA